MPPRATSNTAVSTLGFWSTIWADVGPDMSPFRMSRPSMTMPSVVVMPTRRPMSLRMWAIIRTVVVLPLVPVTPMIGMRACGARREEQVDDRLGHVLRLALGRVRVHPEARRRVDLDDGAALLADGHGDVGHDEVDAGDVEADHAGRRLGDLDVLRMRLDASGRWTVPPVDMLPVRASLTRCPPAGTASSSQPCSRTSSSAAASRRMRVSTFSWPMPRRGSLFSMSTSSRTVCSPSAVTPAGTRSAMATMRPPMTSTR